ncbi:predicted protein [Sclerotinia sclerotiorum 1980 UF-70]|uniref:Uncharacterized protein n=1 Tax=Sclerotinia sclerotiorum (strain ATCC 18683 / 1980 / Ss-1) TaxID=665079 RepID=A7EEM0_SCLS1|nr:predicted protein [Sclerotinia sclerotiorum 1980 UF-70]EDO01286.1 predicted protein [Sclerotinia sclerotiorum 1980 UF-70]
MTRQKVCTELPTSDLDVNTDAQDATDFILSEYCAKSDTEMDDILGTKSTSEKEIVFT